MDDREFHRGFAEPIEDLHAGESVEDFERENPFEVKEDLLEEEEGIHETAYDEVHEDVVDPVHEDVTEPEIDTKSEAGDIEKQIKEYMLFTLEWLQENAILVVGVLIGLIILNIIIKDLKRRWFASCCTNFSNNMDPKMVEMKKDIFASLDTLVSHDTEIRKTGGLKILEIGVGSGANFCHYPDGTHLTAVDPNPHFKKYFNENRKKFPNIISDDIIVTTGEKMDMVPDNSMDVVVVTLVFCSVKDTKKILKNILRVLVPGGRFYFYEHIYEFDPVNHGLRRKLQTLLTITGIWPWIFDNCHLNRDMLKEVEAIGFTKVESERFYAPLNHPIFQIIKPSLKGFAEK